VAPLNASVRRLALYPLLFIIEVDWRYIDMAVHRVEITLNQNGTLTLTDLPFHAGDAVEVIILPRSHRPAEQNAYPLRGTMVEYVHPTDPVAEEEWAALR
jgi:hypothetical protein